MVYTLTSAAANKLLKSYNDKLQHLLDMENKYSTYVEVHGIEPVIPEYSYDDTRKELATLRYKIMKLKHAINVFNTTTVVDDLGLTIDEVLVKMAMLNVEKSRLDKMRSSAHKTINTGFGRSNTNQVEYTVLNYDETVAQKDYDTICEAITDLQVKLDTVNNTLTLQFKDGE